MEKFVTTTEAGRILGVHASRIRQLVLAGVLAAEKWGRDLWLRREDVESLRAAWEKNPPRPGNPNFVRKSLAAKEKKFSKKSPPNT